MLSASPLALFLIIEFASHQCILYSQNIRRTHKKELGTTSEAKNKVSFSSSKSQIAHQFGFFKKT